MPMPFSDMESMEAPGRTFSAPTTLSFSSSVMAFTPVALLPMGRTSSSLKRMLLPFLVPTIISSLPSVIMAAISSSPSLRFWAIIPPFRILSNSSMGVFLIMPALVMRFRYFPSSHSGNSVVTFSPSLRFSRLTMAVPLAVRPASGIR